MKFNVFPTNDGMKFEAFGELLSPYDYTDFSELI